MCDSTGYVLDVLGKYTGLPTFTDYDEMLDEAKPDAVVIATPDPSARADGPRGARAAASTCSARSRSCLDPAEAEELARAGRGARAWSPRSATTTGFVGSFQEVKRLLDAGAIGTVHRALAEAYGPVVLAAAGRDLAQSSAAAAAAASTTTPRTRSTCSPGTSATPVSVSGSRTDEHLLERDRRRRRRHAATTPTAYRAAAR